VPHVEYYEDGEWFPSITTILDGRPKPWLDAWRAKHPVWAPRKVVAASAIGDAFHAATERLARGEDVIEPANRRLRGMLRRIDTWLTESGFKPLHLELHVVSYLYRYSGTLDAIGTLALYGSTLILIDWKTSSGIYSDMGLQLAAYAQAYFEKTGKRIKRAFIVLVSKDKPHHKMTVKEFKVGKRELNKFLKRLEDFRKYAVKRKSDAEMGAQISRDGLFGHSATAEG
jgi:hypothetical protein